MAVKSPIIELKDDGVWLVFGNGTRDRVADMIQISALGKGVQDGIAYSVVRFRDKDCKEGAEVVPTSMLTGRPNAFIQRMTDAHYIWPESKAHRERVVAALSVQNPMSRVHMTMVPGWHGNRFVLPGQVIPADDQWQCHFYRSPSVHLGAFIATGGVAWKKEVARYCALSSRLCLAIGAGFAAPLLRRLNFETFGFYFVGKTSKGKTLCLRVGGSVAGLNDNTSPTSWDGTPTGFQQLAHGHRDNVLLLDDTSAIQGDVKQKRAFVKLTIFSLAKNRQRVRSGHYDLQTEAVESDWRSIILASGEDLLLEPGKQIRGEDVRMIHVPAGVSKRGDIFDGSLADEFAGETTEQRDSFVNRLEKATFDFQGEALREFMKRLVADQNADTSIRTYMKEFADEITLPASSTESAFTRMRRRFAVVYAGLALARDYKILPGEKRVYLSGVKQCMRDAIELMERTRSPSRISSPQTGSDNDPATDFVKRLRSATFVEIGKSNLPRSEIRAADGFIQRISPGKIRVYLQSPRLREWYPVQRIQNQLKQALRDRLCLKAGRQGDVLTRLVTVIPGSYKRLPCYVISLKAAGLSKGDLKVK